MQHHPQRPDQAQDFVTLTALRERGWSPKLIESILGDPDKVARNPYYRCAAPTKLFLTARVEEGEKSESFIAHQPRRKKAQAAACATADRKRDELLDEVNALTFDVPRFPLPDLFAAAVTHWEALQSARGRFDADGRNADDATKKRWAVNFLRHRLTNYDARLGALYRRIGKTEAYFVIKARVNAAILDVYPELRNEPLCLGGDVAQAGSIPL